MRWLWRIEAIPMLPRIMDGRSGSLRIAASPSTVVVYTKQDDEGQPARFARTSGSTAVVSIGNRRDAWSAAFESAVPIAPGQASEKNAAAPSARNRLLLVAHPGNKTCSHKKQFQQALQLQRASSAIAFL